MADVFFCPVTEGEDLASIANKFQALYAKVERRRIISDGDLVAIKTHFGEKGNTTHIAADHIRTIVDLVKGSGGSPYLTETSVLYKSRRMNAVSHILLAYEHGFTFDKVGAPIIMSDGLRGNLDREVEIHGECYESVSVAADAIAPDAIILVSHPTGHLAAGFGAALKNLGMGLSARKGKLSQHSASKPFVGTSACTACEACVRWCPVGAIDMVDRKAFIQNEPCIGCGECITVCKFNAVGFRWDGASMDLQKKMVEHACAVTRELNGRILYFNVLINMTRDCDCMGATHKVLPDIGILASFDPVAIDMATLSLTREKAGKDLAELAFPQLDPMVQIDHAAKLGMGSKDYRLIHVARYVVEEGVSILSKADLQGDDDVITIVSDGVTNIDITLPNHTTPQALARQKAPRQRTAPLVPPKAQEVGVAPPPEAPQKSVDAIASTSVPPSQATQHEHLPYMAVNPSEPTGNNRRRIFWIAGAVILLGFGGAGLYFATRPESQEKVVVPVAIQSYYQKAEAGDSSAMHMLGVMYYHGLGVPQDREKALQWYRKAAAAGNKAAQEELAQMGITQ